MYLIDTSVWIDYLRDISNPTVDYFTRLLDQNLPFGITGLIYQEILQGAATERDFKYLEEYLGTQRFYQFTDELDGYSAAAEIYFRCRRKGITIRSTIDCIIAQIAIEHKLILLHNDADYIRIANVFPALNLQSVERVISYQIHEL